jgi:type I restriction enzyme M protein
VTNDYNLTISRYVSTATPEKPVDLKAVNAELISLENSIMVNTKKHNEYNKELGFAPSPIETKK